jgi:N-dimethylarginine dimethylaminohydrolase
VSETIAELDQEARAAAGVLTPATMESAAFLVAPPLSMAADVPNNIYMQDMSEEERTVDRPAAIRQFAAFVTELSRDGALVYSLPSPLPLQDQPYTSNVGIVLPHRPGTAIVANFCSEPRRGEEKVAAPFLEQLGYTVVHPPELFEGEADMKFLGGNTYACAYGLRTSRAFADWFADVFEADVIAVEMTDPRLYHLDCVILPLPGGRLGVTAERLDPTVLKRLESDYDVIDVPLTAPVGALNSVVSGKRLLSNWALVEHGHNTKDEQLARIHQVERLAEFAGLEPVFLDMSEFLKSGAALSCMAMHLNRRHYEAAAS